MVFCEDHTAHEQHFERVDERVGDLEQRDFEQTQMLARMDAILAQLQKLYWAIFTACAGAIVTALFAVITR